MKNLLLLLCSLFVCSLCAQKSNVKERFEKSQTQDLNVPPPPKILFPAQYPGGMKVFLKDVEKNLRSFPSKTSATQIILKIDADGNLVNVSTFGQDEVFNDQVRDAIKAISQIKWTAGQNSRGEAVIDIVRIPFKYVVK